MISRQSFIRVAAVVALVSEPLLAGEPPAIPPAAARVMYLVRHGAYTPDPKADRSPGPGLSPIGVAQARLAGARLPAGGEGLPSIGRPARPVQPALRRRVSAAWSVLAPE